MRHILTIAVLAIAFTVGYIIGIDTGYPTDVAIAVETAHNQQVIATTEMAAKRYSVCLPGDPNLLPEWAQDPRIPMANLDESYR